jgi:polyisoprenoid-binding protein YceI
MSKLFSRTKIKRGFKNLCCGLGLLIGVTFACHAQTSTPATKHAPTVKFTLVPAKSKITFYVSSSLSDIQGTFSSWHGTLKIPVLGSTDGVSLMLNISTDSMTTGSGMKDGVIKGKDFFNVKEFPSIIFVSTKVIPTSDPSKFQVQGNFTLRGVTKLVTLDATLNKDGTVDGLIHGALSFDRRDFGMTKNMPFNKVADTVKVTLDIDVERSVPVARTAK